MIKNKENNGTEGKSQTKGGVNQNPYFLGFLKLLFMIHKDVSYNYCGWAWFIGRLFYNGVIIKENNYRKIYK